MTPWGISIFQQSTDYQLIRGSTKWQRVQFLTESACQMYQEAGAQGDISGTARHKSTQGTNPHPDLIFIITTRCKSTINDIYAKIWLWRRGGPEPLGIHTCKKMLQSLYFVYQHFAMHLN